MGSSPRRAKFFIHGFIFLGVTGWPEKKHAGISLGRKACLGGGERHRLVCVDKEKYIINLYDKNAALLLKTKDPIFREISSRSLQAIVDKGRARTLRQI